MAQNEAEFTVRLNDKVSASARDAKRALGKLATEIGQLERGIGRADKTIGRTAFSGRGGRSLFGGALDVFKGNLLTMAVTQLGQLAAGVAGAAKEFVTFGQNSRMAFDQLTKNGVGGEKLFEHARTLAKRFGLDLLDTTDSYKKFLAMQFSPKEADKLIRMGADLRALGNSADEVKGVFLAITQIKAKDRLQAQELLQLSERGVSTALVQEEIGKALGKTREEVRKMQEAGKITADVGLAAIEKAINRKLQQSSVGEAGAKFADNTIDGILGRFKAISQDSGVRAVDMVTAPLTRLLGQGLTRFESFISSPEGALALDNIAKALGQAAEFAGKFFGWFREGFGPTWDVLVSSGREFLGMFAGGDGSTTLSLLKTFAQALGQIAAIGVGLTIAIGAVTVGVAALGTVLFEVGKGIVGNLLGQLADAVAGIIGWWDTLTAIWNDKSTSFFTKLFELGKHIVAGLADGIKAAASWPVDALLNIVGGTVDGVKKALGIKSPSRVFGELGMHTGEGFALGIESTTGDVRTAGRDLGRASTSGIDDTAFGPMATTAAAPPSFAAGGVAAGGCGPVSVTVHTEVNGVSDPIEAGEAAARGTRREIESFFRQLNMET